MSWRRVSHLGLTLLFCGLPLFCRTGQRSQAIASWIARYIAAETAPGVCTVDLTCFFNGRLARCDVELTQAGTTTTFSAIPSGVSARELRLIAPGAPYTDSTATHPTVYRALLRESVGSLYRFEIAWMTVAAESEGAMILRRRFCTGLVPLPP